MRVQALIWFLMLLGLPQTDAFAQSHAQRLANEWRQAAGRVTACRATWTEVFASLQVVSEECEAIVFPELLRYSRLQDGMEQAALHILYVEGGKERANFSIGMFQMKPSFAEEVEAAWMKSPMRHIYKLYFDRSGHREARQRRIKRITDERWQCVYLALFVRLLLEREPKLAEMPAEKRVALLATAYNFSFQAPLKTLYRQQHRRTFHLDIRKGKSTVYYAYAEIAEEWYRTAMANRKGNKTR